jgi:AcrR family transcriptional regulator
MSRLSPDDRRRQLVGIGLAMLSDSPEAPLSLDEVAAQAGVSRGLLFHYFPTRTDYLREVVAAGGRRVLRNVAPGEGLDAQAALLDVTTKLIAQIRRRRAFFLALAHGRAVVSEADSPDVATTLRHGVTDLVLEILGRGPADRAVVHGWLAYVEDRALESDPAAGAAADPAGGAGRLANHCVSVLHVLLELDED